MNHGVAARSTRIRSEVTVTLDPWVRLYERRSPRLAVPHDACDAEVEIGIVDLVDLHATDALAGVALVDLFPGQRLGDENSESLHANSVLLFTAVVITGACSEPRVHAIAIEAIPRNTRAQTDRAYPTPRERNCHRIPSSRSSYLQCMTQHTLTCL